MMGIGMTKKLALPTLIALCSIALSRSVQSSMVIIGDFSIAGTIMKAENLPSPLQICLDSGAKKVLLPMDSIKDIQSVSRELLNYVQPIFYNDPIDAAKKALDIY